MYIQYDSKSKLLDVGGNSFFYVFVVVVTCLLLVVVVGFFCGGGMGSHSTPHCHFYKYKSKMYFNAIHFTPLSYTLKRNDRKNHDGETLLDHCSLHALTYIKAAMPYLLWRDCISWSVVAPHTAPVIQLSTTFT